MIPPEEEAQVTAREEHARALAVTSQVRALLPATHLDLMAQSLDYLAAERKRIEALRDTVLVPLRRALDATRALFKPALDALEGTDRDVRAKMAQHYADVRRVNAEAQAAAATAARAGDMAGAKAAASVIVPVLVPRAVHVRTTWGYRIVSAPLLPREFLMPDEKAIAAHAKTGKDGAPPAPVAGVEFIREERVVRNG